MDDKIKNFKYELRELLKKYNAEIYADTEGDGFSNAVVIDIDDKEIMRSYDSVSHNDIK